VEIRLLYDDFGSVAKVGHEFARRLQREGIHCHAFNPASPFLNLFMNHRDHRKITVIDGKVGFTGGYNLADEYFDLVRPYGKWKDTGVRLEGEAVRSLTAVFLELWYVQIRKKEPADIYLNVCHTVEAEGFVQPFADNPLEEDRIAENVYMNLINQANHSLYIMTPYLIITDEMTHALGLAAKRGVDVRIITPGIPDKKTVYAVTRSYYAGLSGQGVRIFEYTPGFCHAKQCICDGEIASIGTSNLDYRSLYHHFENNVLLYGGSAVEAIREDFEDLFPQCEEVTGKYRKGRGAVLMTWQCILRLFAPLM
jgi:cardiolipin synthase